MQVEQVDPPLSLEALGLDDAMRAHVTARDLSRGAIGRVVEGFRKSYLVHTGATIVHAAARAALFHHARGREELPAVGDWVILEHGDNANARVWRTLPRRSALIRQAAGSRGFIPQVMAANLDTIFVVSSLNQEFNLSRLERYLTMVHDSGAAPALVLTKADLCDDPAPYLQQLATITRPDTPILCLSATDERTLEPLRALLQPRQTVALIGSSGVGKSTLVNALYGRELQQTAAVREVDAKGRHTTTTRQLIVMPDGVMLIDTPGMRELQLWHSEGGLSESFEDVIAIAAQCKFRDCAHEHEADCAVKQAVAQGALDARRVASFRKQAAELRGRSFNR